MEQTIMNNLGFPILSTLIFLPVAGAALLLLISRSNENLIKWFSLIVSIAAFIISIPLFAEFNKSTHLMQFTEKHAWIPSLNINYHLGIDGISVLFVLLSTLITILCVLISWNSIKAKTKEFYISILIMEGAMIGVFCSLDFMLFYLFWEAMLIPMYLLIGVWGGTNRIYAAVKFFLFTLVGSVLMLVGIIVLYYQAGGTFDILELTTKTYPYKLQLWLFWAFFAAFAVKVPMFPLHTWLPDAMEGPTPISALIHAATMVAAGVYLIARVYPIFELSHDAMTVIAWTGAITALMAATIAITQQDIKKALAYSTCSQLGFMVMAMGAGAYTAGLFHLMTHAYFKAMLFLCSGAVIHGLNDQQLAPAENSFII